MSSSNSPKDLVKSFTFESLDSTQDEAARLLKQGIVPPFYVQADVQTKGRGRVGRQWVSEKGASLTLTYCCRSSSRFVSGLSLVVGLSVLRASQRSDLALKWPNDIMLGDAKVGGVLIESKSQGETIDFLVGIGLNLKNLSSISFQGLNQQIGARDLVNHLQSDLARFFEMGFVTFLEEYESRMWKLGREVTYEVQGQRRLVEILGVTDEGALRVSSGGALVLNLDGEILHEI
jgi:BirA family biotin operon repressor/biotin-[acetyl-CoA-carboxylase] ligase